MGADMQMCKKNHLRLSQKKKKHDHSNLFSWMISKDRCSKLALFHILSVNTAQKKTVITAFLITSVCKLYITTDNQYSR